MSEEKKADERRCPSCESQSLEARRIRDEFEYGPEGERVMVVAEDVPVLVCPACGEPLYGPEAAAVRHEAICRTQGLLCPADVKAIRERFGPGQEDFARLTGIGVATLSRWERGRLLQTRAMDRYLRLLDNLPQAGRFLETLSRPAHAVAAFHLPQTEGPRSPGPRSQISVATDDPVCPRCLRTQHRIIIPKWPITSNRSPLEAGRWYVHSSTFFSYRGRGRAHNSLGQCRRGSSVART